MSSILKYVKFLSCIILFLNNIYGGNRSSLSTKRSIQKIFQQQNSLDSSNINRRNIRALRIDRPSANANNAIAGENRNNLPLLAQILALLNLINQRILNLQESITNQTPTFQITTEIDLSRIFTVLDQVENRFLETWTILQNIDQDIFNTTTILCNKLENFGLKQAIPISTPTTITQEGNYIVTNDIDGQIIIASDKVSLDCCNFTIEGNSQEALLIQKGLSDIKIFNGKIEPQNSLDNGIVVEEGSSNITIESFDIKNTFSTGISFLGTAENRIKDVALSHCLIETTSVALQLVQTSRGHIEKVNCNTTTTGFYFESCDSLAIKKCTASLSSSAGFRALTSQYLDFCGCIALQTGKTGNHNAFGFISIDGEQNTWIDCQAKDTQSNGIACGIFVAGFAFCGQEKKSIIQNCTARCTQASGQAQAFGILVEDNAVSALISFNIDNVLRPILAHKNTVVGYSNECFNTIAAERSQETFIEDLAVFSGVKGGGAGPQYYGYYNPNVNSNGFLIEPVLFVSFCNLLQAWEALDFDTLTDPLPFENIVKKLDVPNLASFWGGSLYLAVGNLLKKNNIDVIFEQESEAKVRGFICTIKTNDDGNIIYVVHRNQVHRFDVIDGDLTFNTSLKFSKRTLDIATNNTGNLLFVAVGNTIFTYEYVDGKLIMQDTKDFDGTIKSIDFDRVHNVLILGYENVVEVFQWDNTNKQLLLTNQIEVNGTVQRIHVGYTSENIIPLIAVDDALYSGIINNDGTLTHFSQKGLIQNFSQSSSSCVLKNNLAIGTKSDIGGLGIAADGYRNAITSNTCYNNNVNFGCAIPNVFYGSITENPRNLENISLPPF